MPKAFGGLICTLFSLVLCSSLKGQETTETYQIFNYPNGTISSEGYLKDNQPVGMWKAYYVDGTLKSEGIRINGKLDSVWNFYNRKGLIEEKINYHSGKKNGYYYRFDYRYNADSLPLKFLVSEELFVDNNRQGYVNFYWFNGNLKLSIPFENGIKNGTAKEYDEAGNLISIIEYRNGKEVDYQYINRFKNGERVGVWKTFFPNGKLQSEMNYLDGTLTGIVRSYDLSGELISAKRFENDILVDSLVDIGNDIDIKEEFYNLLDSLGEPIKKTSGGFIDNKPIGVHRTYDSLGRVNSSRLYNGEGILIGKGIVNQEGDKVGDWIFYYNTGKIKSEGRYRRNRRTGPWKYYYESGELEQSGIFYGGRPHDKWTWYYKNKNVKREEYYNKGQEQGSFVEYDFNNNIVVKGQFIEGLKEGDWFYDFVTHRESGNYLLDTKNGLWEYYFNNDNIYFKGVFNQGFEDGKHTYYYKSGKVKERRNYQSGQRVKNWEYYDFYGSLIKVLTFENNELVKIDGISIVSE